MERKATGWVFCLGAAGVPLSQSLGPLGTAGASSKASLGHFRCPQHSPPQPPGGMTCTRDHCSLRLPLLLGV